MGLFVSSPSTDSISTKFLAKTNSFFGAYKVLKETVVGSSKSTVEFALTNGELFRVETTPINEVIKYESIEKNTVKVWPTFNPSNYFPSSNSKNQYNSIANEYYSTSTGNYSLIRLNDISETYNYITINANNSYEEIPVFFIVLDKAEKDGDFYHFVIQINQGSNYNEKYSPVIVILDGRYCNIRLDYTGKGVYIDEILYEYLPKSEIDLSTLSSNKDRYTENNIYSNGYFSSIENDYQIYNTQINSYEPSHKAFDNRKFNNYGLFNKSKIKTYSNDDCCLVLESQSTYPVFKDYFVEKNNNSIIFKSKNSIAVLGKSTNKFKYSYSNLLTSQLYSSITYTDNLPYEYPTQFNLSHSTPYEGVDGNYSINFKASSTNNYIIKCGLKSTLFGFVLVSNGSCATYVDGLSSTITTSTVQSSYSLDVRFKCERDEIYIRGIVSEISYDSGWINVCSKSDITSDNWEPYIEIHSLNTSSSYSEIIISNIILHPNLTREEINSVLNKSKYSLSRDYLTTTKTTTPKILPTNEIEGFLVELRNTNKTTILAQNPSSVNGEITSRTFKVSLVYNQYKGDFYYKPNKILRSLTEDNSTTLSYDSCSLTTPTINYNENGVTYDETNSENYYQTNSLTNSDADQTYQKETYTNPENSAVIDLSHCGYIPTKETTYETATESACIGYNDPNKYYNETVSFSNQSNVKILSDSNSQNSYILTYTDFSVTVPESLSDFVGSANVGTSLNLIDKFVTDDILIPDPNGLWMYGNVNLSTNDTSTTSYTLKMYLSKVAVDYSSATYSTISSLSSEGELVEIGSFNIKYGIQACSPSEIHMYGGKYSIELGYGTGGKNPSYKKLRSYLSKGIIIFKIASSSNTPLVTQFYIRTPNLTSYCGNTNYPYVQLNVKKTVTKGEVSTIVYTKLEQEKYPETNNPTTTPISVEYSTLASQYIDNAKDDPRTVEGWKIFNYYQFPIIQ